MTKSVLSSSAVEPEGTPGVVGRKSYTMSVFVRGLAIDNWVDVGIVWQNVNGAGMSYALSPALPKGDVPNWTQLSVTATAPAGAAFAQIILTSRSTGQVWFDDVTFG